MKNTIKCFILIICSLFLFGFNSDYGIKSLEVEGYDINFDPEVVIYNIITNGEKELKINYELEDKANITIEGNEDLKKGSVIDINLSYKNIKRTYKINISSEDSFVYNEINNDVKETEETPLKSIISISLILISIIEIFFIIRTLKKTI